MKVIIMFLLAFLALAEIFITIFDAFSEVYLDDELYDYANLPIKAKEIGYKEWQKQQYKIKFEINIAVLMLTFVGLMLL